MKNQGWLLPFLIGLSSATFAAQDAPITIFTAKKIITMNPMQPEATAVAVKENKIYSVGSLDEMKTWMKPGSYQVNANFANDVITPGLIEAHSHLSMLAVFMLRPYVGYWDFPGFNNQTLPGIKNKADVIKALQKADKALTDPNAVLFAWGYDPIFFNNEDLTAADLDTISKTRRIFVLNASEHIAYVNTALLTKVGYSAQTTIPGVEKGKDGKPDGVLKEMSAAGPVIMSFFDELFSADSFKKGLYGVADIAHRKGLTTVSDLLFGGPGEEVMVNQLKLAANDPNFPVRMSMVYSADLLTMMSQKDPNQGMNHLNDLIKQDTPKLHFGNVKFVADGSIQGYTARLNWPGYFNGMPNGLVNDSTETLKQVGLPFWKAGIPIHVHANGNEATDSVLEALAYLQTTAPCDHCVFVIEHDQMSNTEQFKRAVELGAYVNLFANHIYYWGDQHYSILLGPDRANKIDNAAEAKRLGLLFSLHTDSPVTPLGPLHSMWAAVNRTTASGRVLGESGKISAEDALRAVTINAAYLLNLQKEIGSIELGKRADFTVLARDPLTEPATTLKDIPVVATVQDGNAFLAQ